MTAMDSARQAMGSAISSDGHFLGNASPFRFTVDKSGAPAFGVIDFRGTGGLSAGYEYRLTLAGAEGADLDALIDAPATFTLDAPGGARAIHGHLSAVAATGSLMADHEYEVTLASPIHALNYTSQSRLFRNQSAPDVLKSILAAHGLSGQDYRVALTNDYPVRGLYTQYNETDMAFFRRVAAHAGIFFYFEHHSERSVLVLADDSSQLNSGHFSAPYRRQTGQVETEEAVLTWQETQAVRPRSVRIKDYNPDTPEASLLHEGHSEEGAGTLYVYGAHHTNSEESTGLVRRYQEALGAQRSQYRARTSLRRITAADYLTLTNHAVASGSYLVVAFEERGDTRHARSYGEQRESVAVPTYENELTLLAAGTPYRSLPQTPPQLAGVYYARVESPGGPYAHLDEQGRYRVRPAFDLGDQPVAEATPPLRMMQPYAGRREGMHYPLLAGTDVLLAGINGDPDRPIILGAVPNPDTPSPVTSQNAHEHRLTTPSGHSFVLSDLAGQERIDLHTKDAQNALSLNAQSGAHAIQLASVQGDVHTHAGHTMTVTSGQDHTVTVGRDQSVTVQNHAVLQTQTGSITETSGKDINLKAHETFRAQAQTADVVIQAHKDTILKSGDTFSLHVEKGDLIADAPQGQVSIKAAKEILVIGAGHGDIHIQQPNASLTLTAHGEVVLKGTSITLDAPNIAVKGSAVGLQES